MTNKSNSENREPTIDDIINEIKSKSSNGDYIYRGERQLHCKVSSTLYREHDDIDIEYFDLRNAVSRIRLFRSNTNNHSQNVNTT